MSAITSMARTWLDEHGYDDGSVWEGTDGERIGDALRESDGNATTLWLTDGDIEDATPVDAYVWDDGSAVIITEAYWDLVEDGEAGSGARAYTDEQVDAAAERLSPWGTTLQRGSYTGTSDDRAGRWYWQRYTDTAVDRRGPGYATMREAIEEASGVLLDTYADLVDEMGGPTAASDALGGIPVRETISRRAAGDSRYPVTPEHVYALRYLLGRE